MIGTKPQIGDICIGCDRPFAVGEAYETDEGGSGRTITTRSCDGSKTTGFVHTMCYLHWNCGDPTEGTSALVAASAEQEDEGDTCGVVHLGDDPELVTVERGSLRHQSCAEQFVRWWGGDRINLR